MSENGPEINDLFWCTFKRDFCSLGMLNNLIKFNLLKTAFSLNLNTISLAVLDFNTGGSIQAQARFLIIIQLYLFCFINLKVGLLFHFTDKSFFRSPKYSRCAELRIFYIASLFGCSISPLTFFLPSRP